MTVTIALERIKVKNEDWKENRPKMARERNRVNRKITANLFRFRQRWYEFQILSIPQQSLLDLRHLCLKRSNEFVNFCNIINPQILSLALVSQKDISQDM